MMNMSKKKKIIIVALVAVLLCGAVAFVSMNDPKGIQIEQVNEFEYKVTKPDGTTIMRSVSPARGE